MLAIGSIESSNSSKAISKCNCRTAHELVASGDYLGELIVQCSTQVQGIEHPKQATSIECFMLVTAEVFRCSCLSIPSR